MNEESCNRDFEIFIQFVSSFIASAVREENAMLLHRFFNAQKDKTIVLCSPLAFQRANPEYYIKIFVVYFKVQSFQSVLIHSVSAFVVHSRVSNTSHESGY